MLFELDPVHEAYRAAIDKAYPKRLLQYRPVARIRPVWTIFKRSRPNDYDNPRNIKPGDMYETDKGETMSIRSLDRIC